MQLRIFTKGGCEGPVKCFVYTSVFFRKDEGRRQEENKCDKGEGVYE